jgi:hypothetical protein
VNLLDIIARKRAVAETFVARARITFAKQKALCYNAARYLGRKGVCYLPLLVQQILGTTWGRSDKLVLRFVGALFFRMAGCPHK